MDNDEFLNTLTYLLSVSYDDLDIDLSKEKARLIVNKYSYYNINESYFPVVTQVFTLKGFSNEWFKFYAKCMEEVDYVHHVTNLFNYSDDLKVLVPLKRIDDAFEVIDPKFYEMIFKELDNYLERYNVDQPVIRSFIDERYRKISSHAPIKAKLINVGRELTHQDLLLNIKDDKNAKLNVTPSIIAMGLSDYMAREGLIDEDDEQFVTDTLALSFEVGEEVGKNVEEELKFDFDFNKTFTTNDRIQRYKDSKEVFRTFGPSNPRKGYIGKNDDEEDECMKYGGCRMLLCIHNEEPDEYEDEDYATEWFTGTCLVSRKKIEQKHHAVRKPLPSGGWIGCYSSWNYVREDTESSIILAMIDQYEALYDKYGIYDRKWESKYDIELPEVSIEDVNAVLDKLLSGDFEYK